MGKRAEFHPAWLVSLLNQWAIHDYRGITGGLGYASGSGWMRGLKSSPASSIDPTGYAARDYRDIDSAMERLMDDRMNQWAAVKMYYCPWVIEAFRAAGYPFQNSTYYDRLHLAHAELERTMARIKAERAERLETIVINLL